MLEKDLAKHFIEFFSCFNLYFEVDYWRCVDIVALAENYTVAIEVKTSFNFKVLEQAVENRNRFNYSYIGIPATKSLTLFQRKLCEDYGIGLLIYDEKYIRARGGVLELVAPKLNRHASKSKLLPFLHEYSKKSIAGSKSGDGTKITAFSITVENLCVYVKRNNGCLLKVAVDNFNHHYGDHKSACVNLYKWITKGVIKEVELRDGKLYLTEIGEQKLKQHEKEI